jgi:L-cysteine S-thiosulfotransferase
MNRADLCCCAWLLWAAGLTAWADEPRVSERRSGYEFMSAATQAMQRDDTLNPAMLWVKQGEALWQSAEGKDTASCEGCHGAAPVAMRGVAARYPAWDAVLQTPQNLAQRINQCRVQHQKAQPWRFESAELLSLESYVAYQSRGLPLAPVVDQRLQAALERGRSRYQQRMGQLDLSCAQCHDQRWGQRLGGSVIPQAHVGNYPVYRLEWQALGSLQRRIRNCMNGVRTQAYAFGAPELVELELYLADRSRAMTAEAPGIRP